MSTTGWRVGTSVASQPSARERGDRLGRPLRRAPLALEHECAHRLVDRGEVAVQQLLRLVRLGRQPRPLAELQHRLVRGRESRPAPATRNRSCVPTCGRSTASASATAAGSHATSSPRSAAIGCHRARVARGVAPALLDRGRAHDHLVAELRDRPVGLAGDEPPRTAPGPRRLERERRLPFVGDEDEHVGVALGREHELERLHRLASRPRRVEGRAAAGEERPRAVGEPPVRRHLREPLRLRGDRRLRPLSRHSASIPSTRWRGTRSCTPRRCGSETSTAWGT